MYRITMESQRDLLIMRVENGWVIRNHSDMGAQYYTPMTVAETADALVKLVLDWATAQEAPKS